MTEQFIEGPHGRIAFAHNDGREPTVVWLGGFQSDMTGTKATHLHAWAEQRGQSFLRFDYSGHGSSDGNFEDGCISEWRDDAKTAIHALTKGQLILVGSSMGAWIAGLIAREISNRITGLVFIAPAPDFTEALIWPLLGTGARTSIMEHGRAALPSLDDNPPTLITRKLIEDARNNLLLSDGLTINAPVRILQGMADSEVPWKHAMQFAEKINTTDLEIIMTKTGDHRLSTPPDLERLTNVLDAVCKTND
ncbi:MAG: alpha/beta hydrolase [Pseudomonadota bacterium]